MGKRLRPDDLKPGVFFALSGVVNDDSEENYLEKEDMFFGRMKQRRTDRYAQFDGTPLEILEVSLPFICVNNGQATFGMDIRGLVMVQLSEEFVDEMRASAQHNGMTSRGERKVTPREKRRRKKEHKQKILSAKKDKRICPRCFNAKTTQILRDGQWYYHCDQCELDRPIEGDNGSGSPVQD